ncbi:ftsH3, partial [Symbiodinium pilosum]
MTRLLPAPPLARLNRGATSLTTHSGDIARPQSDFHGWLDSILQEGIATGAQGERRSQLRSAQSICTMLLLAGVGDHSGPASEDAGNAEGNASLDKTAQDVKSDAPPMLYVDVNIAHGQ